eukprot:Cvel_28137.t1-p1 / transcript=Cvel_28137.t1 / gene=Cvel_28137 / organism=Chromera_velia_CCMP2878 / gene_product=hypothetical protein / transcript_product=hypothetical protein / location=Cvel_scaffold3632:16-1509(-) / protein_length=498 / sequence_SO=supercontig / SO=protein_coding / is_pseudo=false
MGRYSAAAACAPRVPYTSFSLMSTHGPAPVETRQPASFAPPSMQPSTPYAYQPPPLQPSASAAPASSSLPKEPETMHQQTPLLASKAGMHMGEGPYGGASFRHSERRVLELPQDDRGRGREREWQEGAGPFRSHSLPPPPRMFYGPPHLRPFIDRMRESRRSPPFRPLSPLRYPPSHLRDPPWLGRPVSAPPPRPSLSPPFLDALDRDREREREHRFLRLAHRYSSCDTCRDGPWFRRPPFPSFPRWLGRERERERERERGERYRMHGRYSPSRFPSMHAEDDFPSLPPHMQRRRRRPYSAGGNRSRPSPFSYPCDIPPVPEVPSVGEVPPVPPVTWTPVGGADASGKNKGGVEKDGEGEGRKARGAGEKDGSADAEAATRLSRFLENSGGGKSDSPRVMERREKRRAEETAKAGNAGERDRQRQRPRQIERERQASFGEEENFGKGGGGEERDGDTTGREGDDAGRQRGRQMRIHSRGDRERERRRRGDHQEEVTTQ